MDNIDENTLIYFFYTEFLNYKLLHRLRFKGKFFQFIAFMMDDKDLKIVLANKISSLSDKDQDMYESDYNIIKGLLDTTAPDLRIEFEYVFIMLLYIYSILLILFFCYWQNV